MQPQAQTACIFNEIYIIHVDRYSVFVLAMIRRK